MTYKWTLRDTFITQTEKDFDINNPGTNTFSIKYVTKNLQVSRRFLTKVLDFIGKHPKEKGKIFYTIEGTNITVKCKRLKNLCDTWTQKQLRLNFDATSISLRPIEVEEEEDRSISSIHNTVVSSEPEKDSDKKETKKEDEKPAKKKKEYSESFELFWNVYPRKTGKWKAYARWQEVGKQQRIGAIEITTRGIIDIVKKQKDANHLRMDDTKYIPLAETWLNQRRWEDEIDADTKPHGFNILQK